ncbi:MAG: peptidoglycan-associated lipoprotein Pal [Alphaproteobacteria bacterium]|nr:peptidoglycan-associated lipoprotein Pal [Alphaproteobacteria bacterium]
MSFRHLLVLSLALLVTACSGDTSQTDLSVSEREGITGAAVDGMEGYDETTLNGPAPGTQQDLVVNIGDRVFFGYDRYDLNAEAQATLGMQADWLNRHPNITVTIEGHADERGTREYNLALGERRANSVRRYLMALGVDANRINVISYGKERPAVLGSNPSSWAQNRRGVTVVD